jgi:hypothetical protein
MHYKQLKGENSNRTPHLARLEPLVLQRRETQQDGIEGKTAKRSRKHACNDRTTTNGGTSAVTHMLNDVNRPRTIRNNHISGGVVKNAVRWRSWTHMRANIPRWSLRIWSMIFSSCSAFDRFTSSLFVVVEYAAIDGHHNPHRVAFTKKEEPCRWNFGIPSKMEKCERKVDAFPSAFSAVRTTVSATWREMSRIISILSVYGVPDEVGLRCAAMKRGRCQFGCAFGDNRMILERTRVAYPHLFFSFPYPNALIRQLAFLFLHRGVGVRHSFNALSFHRPLFPVFSRYSPLLASRCLCEPRFQAPFEALVSLPKPRRVCERRWRVVLVRRWFDCLWCTSAFR